VGKAEPNKRAREHREDGWDVKMGSGRAGKFTKRGSNSRARQVFQLQKKGKAGNGLQGKRAG